MERCLNIFQSNLTIIRRLLSYCKELQQDRRVGYDQGRRFKQGLQEQSSIVYGHVCKVKMLIQSCDVTAQMVCLLSSARPLLGV